MLASVFARFLDDESGATAIEYGLIGTLMAIACIVAFGLVGTGLLNLFGSADTGAGGEIIEAAGQVND